MGVHTFGVRHLGNLKRFNIPETGINRSLVTALVIVLNAYLTIKPQHNRNNTSKLTMIAHNSPCMIVCQFV